MPYRVDLDAIAIRVVFFADVKAALDSAGTDITADRLRARLLQRSDEVQAKAANAIAAADGFESTTRSAFIELFASVDIGSGSMASTSSGASDEAPDRPFLEVDRFSPQEALGQLLFELDRKTVPDVRDFVMKRITDLKLDTAAQQLTALRSAADDALFTAALQEAFVIINELGGFRTQARLYVPPMTPPASCFLTLGRGLTEIVDPENEIPTAARRSVVGMLESMSGGSIGIAGPRGAGKSTLLSSVCRSSPAAGKTITVHTSAPVQYDSRDFQLHIFSSLCLAVLDAEHVGDDRRAASFEDDEPHDEGTRALVMRYAFVGGRWLQSAGIVAFLLGILLAVLFVVQLRPFAAGERVAVQKIAAPTGSAARISSNADRQKVPEPSAAPSPPTVAATTALVFGAFGLKSDALIQWGFLTAIVGWALRSAVWEMGRMSEERSRRRESEIRRAHDGSALVVEARRILRDIRFQRSYSSGWAGALKVAPGIELSTNTALSIAQRQETLPELVQRFREFVRSVTAKDYSRVIIGIDELDKLESDEKAQQFLNDMKAIFNLPKCFYLVTVSESAISNFERRGLSFRDAFDSTFDDIFYVGYLRLQESRDLLDRRVLQLPNRFAYLCHAMAAGLPRDLIRAARTMLEFVKDNPQQNDIVAVATALIRRDVSGKIRATEIAARKSRAEPETSTFLSRLSALKEVELSSASSFDDPGASLAWEAGRSDADREDIASLRILGTELACFLRYAATLLKLFEDVYAPGKVLPDTDHTWVEGLARVRQAFEIGAGAAGERLRSLRQHYGLDLR
jgi:energy-coupling factor transporter ATP-binding protein EcfA2